MGVEEGEERKGGRRGGGVPDGSGSALTTLPCITLYCTGDVTEQEGAERWNKYENLTAHLAQVTAGPPLNR